MNTIQEYLEKNKNCFSGLAYNTSLENIFLKIAREIIRYLNLTDYVDDILIKKSLIFAFDGYYDGRNIVIGISTEQSTASLYYYKMFSIFFHELQHAIQAKLIDKYNWYYGRLPYNYNFSLTEQKEISKAKIIGLTDKILFSNKMCYFMRHDLFVSEHEANFYSYINTENLLMYLFPEFSEKINKHDEYCLNALKLLLEGYKLNKNTDVVISPLEQILTNNKIFNNLLSLFEAFDGYEKMIFGLPIDIDTYLKINHSVTSGVLPDDIKKYILNL